MFLRNKFVFGVLLLLLAGFAAGQNSAAKKGPVPYTSPTSGAEMYTAYCASCHGKDGLGDGPAAPALKVAPPDLTVIAKRNHGRFPGGNIYQTVKWGGAIAAHGSKEMPVWSTTLRSVGSQGEAEVELRIKSLVKYIESLQVK